MKKRILILITIVALISGVISLAPTWGFLAPLVVNMEIGKDYILLTPPPSKVENNIFSFYTEYRFPDTYGSITKSSTSSEITVLSLYPLTVITPTTYLATETATSMIIAAPSYFSEKITASTGGEVTATETQTASQSTSSVVITIPEIKAMDKKQAERTIWFLNGNQLYKILKAYTRDHDINTPTDTLKSISTSIAHWSKTFGIDPLLIASQIRWESKFNPKATSKSDAKGLMQLKDFVYKPAANFLGLNTSTDAIYDIDNNIAAGTYYLYHKLRTWGTEEGALGSYLLGDTGYLMALWNETEGKDSIGTTYEKYIKKIMDTRNELRAYMDLPPYKSELSVYISPGHGTYDEGYYDMGALIGRYRESVINLQIALKLKNILESHGVKVYMAREKENNPETPYLSQRVRMINTLHPNVVISIHANANPYSSSIRGYEIYYRKSYDRFLAKSIDKAMNIASPIPKHKDPRYMKLIILSGWPPSVLIETGYMTNSTDLSLLLDSDYQWTIAHSIAQGVLTFLGKTGP